MRAIRRRRRDPARVKSGEEEMSIFGDIMDAIFGGGAASANEAQPTSAGGSASRGKAAASNVDIGAILDKKAQDAGEKLNWRKSIVDLMKLLKLDSSAKARKALADELKYPGDQKDSAAMNIWLHKQVMTKLAENGGVVPKELQD
jgi:hypothetical protein